MASYSSSARSVGFNPIQVPDSAQRVLDEGKNRIQKLREVYKQDIDNRNQYAQAIRQNNADSMRQVESNRALQQQFDRVYEQNLLKQYKQKTEKYAKEQEAKRSMYDRLSSFSKEAMNVGKELYKKNKEDQIEYGMWLASQFGVTPEELEKLNKGEAELKAESTANNAVATRLKQAGASPDQIAAIRNLDGWRLYGAEQVMAQNGKGNWYAFLQNPTNRQKQYDIDGNGRMMSLEEAEQLGDGSAYRTVRGLMQAEFSRPYAHLDRAFATKYFYPGLNEVNQVDDRNFTTKANKVVEEQETNARRTDGLNSIKTLDSNPYAIEEYLKRQSGGKGGEFLRAAREEFVEDLYKLAEEGILTQDQFEAVMGSKLKINGKEVSFGEQYKNTPGTAGELTKIQELFENKSEKERRRTLEDKQESAKKAQEEFLALALQGGLTEADYAEWQKSYREKYGLIPINSEVQRYLSGTYDKLAVEKAEQEIEERLADGTLTREDLVGPRYAAVPAAKRNQYIAALYSDGADPNNPGGGSKNSPRAALKAALKESLGQFGTTETTSEVETMVHRALADYEARVNAQVTKGESFQQAREDALRGLVKEIRTGSGNYEVKKGPNGDPILGEGAGFVYNNKPLSTVNEENFVAIAEAYGLEKSALWGSRKLLGEIGGEFDQISALNVQARRTLQPTAYIERLARLDPSKTWKQIANEQLEMYGLPPITYARDEAVVQVVSPSMKELIANMPSTAKTSRALTRTAEEQGYTGVSKYKPMLDLMASKESSNDTVHNGYDALNRGGTNGGHTSIGTSTGLIEFQKPLTEMTYGEIRDMQRTGALHAVGRYQFINLTLADMEERGLVDPRITDDTPFNEETQDRLAIAYLNESISAYAGSDGRILNGLGRRWIGLQKVDQGKLQEALDIIQGDIRFNDSFQGVDFDPNQLVHFYTGGNIGPTSTGQHTDIKQQDNPNTPENEFGRRFEYNDLDQYVFVQDRELGLVPIGQTPQTGDWDYHINKGSHGRDYGTYEGDKLYLKNGAKMISNTPTVHGDKVTIELPDGRRFSFLHGRGT